MGISSGSGLSARSAAQKYGFAYTASSSSQILEDPQINTVALLTRHHLHARQVVSALAAGKNVFCEKPLALNNAELDEIAAALAQPNAPLLMVGFNRRFAPLAVQMKAFLDQRQEPLFAQYRINAGYIPLSSWVHDPAQGGGRIIGEGCHFIDLLTFLVGAPPSKVTAQGLPENGRYNADNVHLSFEFPDGSIGVVDYFANGDKAFPKERVEAFSGGRIAVLDDYRSLEMVSGGQRKVVRSVLRQDKGHQAEWAAYAAAISAGGQPPIPYNQLFGVTRASFAAVESLGRNEGIALIPG